MVIHIHEDERSRMDECFDRFRKAAHSLVQSSLDGKATEHETRPLLRDLQRKVEKDLAEILGPERASTFCSELVVHPDVEGCIAEYDNEDKPA